MKGRGSKSYAVTSHGGGGNFSSEYNQLDAEYQETAEDSELIFSTRCKIDKALRDMSRIHDNGLDSVYVWCEW